MRKSIALPCQGTRSHFSGYATNQAQPSLYAAQTLSCVILLANEHHMMPMRRTAQSRYLTKCPACGVAFQPSQVPTFATSFPCPNCGVELKYAAQHRVIIAVLSVLVAAGLPFIFGLKGVAYVFSAAVALPLVWLLMVGIVSSIDPPPAQRVPEQELPLTVLKLTDKRKR